MYIRLLQNYCIFELVGFVLIIIHSSFFLLLRSYCSTKNRPEWMYSSLLLSLRLEQCQNYSKCDERKISFVKLGDKAFLRLHVKFFVKLFQILGFWDLGDDEEVLCLEGLWSTSRLRYLSWTVTYHFCILIFMIRKNRSGIQIELREYNRDHCEPGGASTEHILTMFKTVFQQFYLWIYFL